MTTLWCIPSYWGLMWGFSFNWIGLINKASGTLAMIVHAPLQQKLKTAEGQQGTCLHARF